MSDNFQNESADGYAEILLWIMLLLCFHQCHECETLKYRIDKGVFENQIYKMVQQITSHRYRSAVIFSGVCRGISNQGTMVTVQYLIKGVKLSYNYHRASGFVLLIIFTKS